MTIDKREMVNIPKIWVILLLPLIVGIIGGALSSSYGIGRYANQVEINTKRLDIVEKNKVDNDKFTLIENSLDRIESKIDQHLLQSTKPVLTR
jgi:hypothetical protein